MKTISALFLLAICIALPGLASAYDLGVGAYGGLDIPVLQGDVGSGSMWGLGVRGNIWGPFQGQLLLRGTSQGEVTQKLDGTPDVLKFKGGTLTGFGANVTWGGGRTSSFSPPYLLVGVSTNSLSFKDSYKKSESHVGGTGGVGFCINLYNRALYLDVNTTLLVMPFHDNASRKNWQTLGGLQYFFPLPFPKK